MYHSSGSKKKKKLDDVMSTPQKGVWQNDKGDWFCIQTHEKAECSSGGGLVCCCHVVVNVIEHFVALSPSREVK